MTTDAREQEIQKLENSFWNAMQAKDGAAAARMTDDGCIVVGAQGIGAIDAKSMGEMTTGGAWELTHFEFDPKSISDG